MRQSFGHPSDGEKKADPLLLLYKLVLGLRYQALRSVGKLMGVNALNPFGRV